jgi:regulatory protein
MPNALRERALRLLARRDYARRELSRKLAPFAESSEDLEALLVDLTARHLLSDERFAKARLASRGALVGNARLAYELRSKGISAELVRATLAGSEDELTRARRVWQRRFGEHAHTVGNAAERARQIRFLLARGFSGETIRRLLNTTFEDD